MKNKYETNLKDTFSIVGGLPHPYGGVTVFLRRLLERDAHGINCFTDLYQGSEKIVPRNYTGVYRRINYWILPFFLYYDSFFTARNKVFYNFSRANSLLLFFLLPKKSDCHWHLMLHHGQLQSKLPNFVVEFILRKFDKIYSLSDEQSEFYGSFELNTVVKASSYVQASRPVTEIETTKFDQIEDKEYFLSSGYATAIYNHAWCIEYFASKPSLTLVICLYGPTIGRSSTKELAARYDNIFILEDLDEQEFNSVLIRSRCYLRPTNADSFGIAVADAIGFGVDCIASDVCLRASGTIIFPTNSKSDFFTTLNGYMDPNTATDLDRSDCDIEEFRLRI